MHTKLVVGALAPLSIALSLASIEPAAAQTLRFDFPARGITCAKRGQVRLQYLVRRFCLVELTLMRCRSFGIALSLALCLLALGGVYADARTSNIAAEGRLPLASLLPVGRDDVWSVDDGSGVDRQATVTGLPSGGFLLVYSEFRNGGMDSARLRLLVSRNGKTLSSSRSLAFGGEIEDAPVFINSADGTWLYYASSDSDLGNIKLWRARVADGKFAKPDRLGDVERLQRLDQFPRWVESGKDVLLTFRSVKSRPLWLRMADGVSPGVPVTLAPMRVAYPRVVPMGGKGCFFSYQRPPEGGYMATYYSVSRDCSAWSSAAALSHPKPPNKPDVHDANALPRTDGGVDVYYVYPSFKGKAAKFPVGFDLYRRSVMTDGRAGPEELLTERVQFNPFAPSAHRLPDDTILVSFSD